jgi:hypothetical protein
MTDMPSRNFGRRLERLEARLTPPSHPPVMEIRILASATGEIIDQYLTLWGTARTTGAILVIVPKVTMPNDRTRRWHPAAARIQWHRALEGDLQHTVQR